MEEEISMQEVYAAFQRVCDPVSAYGKDVFEYMPEPLRDLRIVVLGLCSSVQGIKSREKANG